MVQLKFIKTSELESSLLVLPFHYVMRFIPLLTQLCKLELDVELSARCVIYVLRCHMARIMNTQSLYHDMLLLREIVRSTVGNFRSVVGTNMAALIFLSSKVEEDDMSSLRAATAEAGVSKHGSRKSKNAASSGSAKKKRKHSK